MIKLFVTTAQNVAVGWLFFNKIVITVNINTDIVACRSGSYNVALFSIMPRNNDNTMPT